MSPTMKKLLLQFLNHERWSEIETRYGETNFHATLGASFSLNEYKGQHGDLAWILVWCASLRDQFAKDTCGECAACLREKAGCDCNKGAIDDGCFVCAPSSCSRPPCPAKAASHG